METRYVEIQAVNHFYEVYAFDFESSLFIALHVV